MIPPQQDTRALEFLEEGREDWLVRVDHLFAPLCFLSWCDYFMLN